MRRALPWVIAAALGLVALDQWHKAAVTRQDGRHFAAWDGFLLDLHEGQCIRPDKVKAMAQARGWTVRETNVLWPDCPQLQGSLEIGVEPPLPFGKWGRLVAFDGEGCLATRDVLRGC